MCACLLKAYSYGDAFYMGAPVDHTLLRDAVYTVRAVRNEQIAHHLKLSYRMTDRAIYDFFFENVKRVLNAFGKLKTFSLEILL